MGLGTGGGQDKDPTLMMQSELIATINIKQRRKTLCVKIVVTINI